MTKDGERSWRPTNFYCINIGELVRKSKTRTSWHFILDDIQYVFELEHSKVTGKKRINRNNCLIYETASRSPFEYELRIGEHILAFAQNGDGFDLRIDNESFMYVYNKIK